MERVWYLVEELCVGVNQPGYTQPMAFGTPLMYAVEGKAVEGDGGVVVRYLLEHGADPYRRDCYDYSDTFGRAKGGRNYAAMRVLDWKASRGLSDRASRG